MLTACASFSCLLTLPLSIWHCRYRAKKRKEEQRRQKEEAEAAAKEAAAEAAAAKKGEKGEEKRKRWVIGCRQAWQAGGRAGRQTLMLISIGTRSECPADRLTNHSRHLKSVCRDPDPEGRQLAAVADPLAEAAKLLRRLREHAGDKLLVQQLSFEVYLRQGKLLLAVHAAKAAQRVAGAADPSVHSMVVRLAAAVVAAAAAAAASPEAAVPAVVLEVAQARV